ncbi:MAG: 1,4-dihydroxy-2-naphthoate octaprenyltransferase [Paludibacter sp.]|jgi:1,4-dihydroxy-2-naphthoate octaprenyltransferase|nr:1,4-dihydroxy-2-naphthoate octaprenyltransferase [Paludibacter sp.]
MANNFNAWLSAFRPKTLLLAVANTLVGSAVALLDGGFRLSVFLLAAATTLLLQILGNLANDYGDFVNGKDTAQRIGPKRMVQTGKISERQMFKAIVVAGILCFLSGAALVFVSVGWDFAKIVFFGFLGLAAIAAAVKYTVGKKPYGYRGLGDIFVFVFFGLVGVGGTYFLHTLAFRADVLLPAAAVGLLSVGALNMNNMRDFTTDSQSGKRTLVVIFGQRWAKFYHLFLVAAAIICTTAFTLLNYKSAWQWLWLVCLPPLAINFYKVFTFNDNAELYPELPRISLATLLLAAGFLAGMIFPHFY